MTGTPQVTTTLRKVPLDVLAQVLREQADVRFDAVVPASALSYVNGQLHVADAATRWDADGASLEAAVLAPTDVFEDGLAARLEIPRAYLRKMRDTGIRVMLPTAGAPHRDHALIDANVNAWLQAQGDRRFLIRAFRTDDPDSVGIARAFLSNKFSIGMDNLDVLLAALAGARAAGVSTAGLNIDGDLSERRMQVRIEAPEVAALAPLALRSRYRDPRTGRTAMDYPLVSAGVVIGNSETGGGAFTVAPRFVFQVCKNGMVRSVDLIKAVHVGGRLDDGIVRWSAETQRANVDLITAKTRDAVATFLDTDYVERCLTEITEQAEVPVTDAAATIERVAKAHAFTEDEARDILDHFIRGGDLTAGGVMQAVTSAAQDVADPDRAAVYEDVALDVLATAAKR